jgi:hypothetical protein
VIADVLPCRRDAVILNPFFLVIAECRKQTNKKSLCITHYKEEYEVHPAVTSSWPNQYSSFQILSLHPPPNDHEQQNDTISTSNMVDTDDPYSDCISPASSLHEGEIRLLHNGRRFILKNSQWQPLCKYDNSCRSAAQYELLCIKHFEITQQRQRTNYKYHTSTYHHGTNSMIGRAYRLPSHGGSHPSMRDKGTGEQIVLINDNI